LLRLPLGINHFSISSPKNFSKDAEELGPVRSSDFEQSASGKNFWIAFCKLSSSSVVIFGQSRMAEIQSWGSKSFNMIPSCIVFSGPVVTNRTSDSDLYSIRLRK
jgi:hypothetical protein